MLYCGIDISKATFDVALFDEVNYETAQFENTQMGINGFIQWCETKKQMVLFCMEATGIYHLQLARALHRAELKVVVINPIKTSSFARMEMQRNKTDDLDAQMIARFCFHLMAQGQFEQHLFKPKSQQFEQLTSLVNRREQLLLVRTEESNRRQVTECPISLKSINTIIKCIDDQIKSIEQELKRCQKEDALLDQQIKLLVSIDGIGLITAWTILAYLGDINQYTDAGKVASYAGLTPRRVESGSSIKKSRLSKMGHRKLRKSLYFPAIVSCQHNPVLQAKYQSMLERGKSKKTALCAIMRKLLVIAYGVLKSGMAFDPEYQKKGMQRTN